MRYGKRIFTQADESYCLTVRNNNYVVLAPANPRDEYQHWFKDMSYGSRVKDEAGLPSFALVNRATGQAIQHSIGQDNPVRLVPFDPNHLDKSVLWTEYGATGEDFSAIRMAINIHLNLDAFGGNTEVYDGTIAGLWEWKDQPNQKWKIEAWESHPGWQGQHLTREPTVSVFTMEDAKYSLAISNEGKVVLAPVDRGDTRQHWIKDMRYSMTVKDEDGRPSFSLVNKATGQAIKHAIGATHPVRLVQYNSTHLDESILWTEGKDTGGGFRAIRMASNINLNLDAFRGVQPVHDGTIVGLWEWKDGDNQKWKIVPYCKFLEMPCSLDSF